MKIIKFLLCITAFILSLGVCSESSAQVSIDFESGVPLGWQITGDWQIGDADDAAFDFFSTYTIADHTEFAYINDVNNNNGFNDSQGDMITDWIDLTSGLDASAILSFESCAMSISDNSNVSIFIRTLSDTTWTNMNYVFYESLYETDPTYKPPFSFIFQWRVNSIPFSNYVGETIQLMFSCNDFGGIIGGICIDDIKIENTPYDIELYHRLDTDYFGIVGMDNVVFAGYLYNFGVETITSVDFNVVIDGVVHTETIENLNIPYGSHELIEHSYDFDESFPRSSVGQLFFSAPNGEPNFDPASNIVDITIDIVEAAEHKVVLVEGITGTWCPPCVGLKVYMDYLDKRYGNRIANIATHAGDPMEYEYYDSNVGSYPSIQGRPSALVDRNGGYIYPQFYTERSVIEDDFIKAIQVEPSAIVDIDIEHDINTNLILIDLSIEALKPLDGDYLVNLIIREDGVTGTTEGYDQNNAYAYNGYPNPMGGFELLPNPVPAALMTYDHVARDLIWDFDGMSVNLEMEVGETKTWQVEYQANDEFDVSQFVFIGTFQDMDTTIMDNAVIKKYSEMITTGIDNLVQQEKAEKLAKVYPIPTTQNLTIDIPEMGRYRLFSVSGELVKEGILDQNVNKLNVNDLQNGTYFVEVRTARMVEQHKIMILNQ